MNIEVSEAQQELLDNLKRGKNIANVNRGESISNRWKTKGCKQGVHVSKEKKARTYRRRRVPLDASKLRSEDEIKYDLAQVLHEQLGLQLKRWGFI